MSCAAWLTPRGGNFPSGDDGFDQLYISISRRGPWVRRNWLRAEVFANATQGVEACTLAYVSCFLLSRIAVPCCSLSNLGGHASGSVYRHQPNRWRLPICAFHEGINFEINSTGTGIGVSK